MNARMFENHEIRKEIKLSPVWDFHTLNEKGEKDRSFHMIVPACWESNPLLSSYKGQALYSQKVVFGGNVRLVFKGISHTASVYVDGAEAAYHYNAYTEFAVVLKSMPYGEHLIEVKVDNTFHEESSLHLPNDYYSYGGITRPVIFEQLPDVYIKNIQCRPYRTGSQWRARIRVVLENVSKETVKFDLRFRLEENEYTMEQFIDAEQELIFTKEYEFSEVKEYTLENPVLYYLNTSIVQSGIVMDDLIDRIGFREIKVIGRDILFNDKKIIIKGVNRHEDYAEFGCAVPVEAMYRDIEIIKSLGANCVRTCHYPNDERFLDLCDENGIVVWEEAHARGLNETQMKHKNFDLQSAACIQEMIENHYNHPSIFVWGILNECVSNTEFGKSVYKKQFDQIKALDDSRPVSYAALQGFIGSDLSLDLVDIVSYNIYPKWYENISSLDLVKKLKDFVATTEGKDKPLLISEIGAGGIYGHRSSNCEKWTEDYQEILLEEQLTTVLGDEDLSGVIIWQYADCRVDPGWFGGRPKCQNNKGLVDIYRREKLAFKKVKQIFENY